MGCGRVKGNMRGQMAVLALLSVGIVGTPFSPGQVMQGPPVQTVPGASGSHRPSMGVDPPELPGPLAAGNAARLEHLREDERHRRIVADTERLVALANELKADVEKATKDQLSLEVVRKAAEIEKLARDVKERMKS